jgi:hypothetical protein
MINLASPTESTVRKQRFGAVCAAAAHLMRAGHTVFAPIEADPTYSLAAAKRGGWSSGNRGLADHVAVAG